MSTRQCLHFGIALDALIDWIFVELQGAVFPLLARPLAWAWRGSLPPLYWEGSECDLRGEVDCSIPQHVSPYLAFGAPPSTFRVERFGKMKTLNIERNSRLNSPLKNSRTEITSLNYSHSRNVFITDRCERIAHASTDKQTFI